MQQEHFSYNHIISENALDMLAYVQKSGKFKCQASYAIKRKKYDSLLLVLTLSGKGFLKYRNKQFEVGEGKGMLIDCNEPHVYFTDKRELWDFIWIHFHGGQSLKQAKFILETGGPVFAADKTGAVYRNMCKILEMGRQKGLAGDIVLSGCLNEIMVSLMLHALQAYGVVEKRPDIVVKALERIESLYMYRMELEELAKQLYTNKYYLIRLFKKYVGITPYEYLLKYRISQAKTLLEGTSLPVAEIAGRVGFEDPGYFVNVFRRRENITPSKYRKYWSMY